MPESADENFEPDERRWSWGVPAALGALFVHPLVMLFCFCLGALFGAKPFMPDGAPKETGVTGGVNALGSLAIFYLGSIGIAPLVLSLIGGFAAVWYSALKNDPTG